VQNKWHLRKNIVEREWFFLQLWRILQGRNEINKERKGSATREWRALAWPWAARTSANPCRIISVHLFFLWKKKGREKWFASDNSSETRQQTNKRTHHSPFQWRLIRRKSIWSTRQLQTYSIGDVLMENTSFSFSP
jgi:hypothetical protein